MDATPAQPGDCDYEEDVGLNANPATGLRSSLISGTSAG
jgi:hypothetical protein